MMSEKTTAELVKAMNDKDMQAYVSDLVKEQESMVARFMMETGLKASEIVIVERRTEFGSVYHPEAKAKLEGFSE